jgi:hypothetical protein
VLLLLCGAIPAGALGQSREANRDARKSGAPPSPPVERPVETGRLPARFPQEIGRVGPDQQEKEQKPGRLPQPSRFPLVAPDRVMQEPEKTIADAHRRIFTQVQEGLASGNVRSISSNFGSQVYMNLRGGESGYFSSNQAYYVLENYLKTRKLVNISFSTTGELESRPYATGSAALIDRGNREIAQVYVSLAQVGEKWIITQINIY